MSLDVSPCGDVLIFEHLGHLYRLPLAGGEAIALTTGESISRYPAISSDCRHLAFVSDRGGADNLWIANVDGTEARQLSDLAPAQFHSAVAWPSWSPDGKLIAAAVAPSTADLRQGVGRGHWLALFNTATGAMQWVWPPAEAAPLVEGLTFEPTGRHMYAAVPQAKSPPNEYFSYILRIDPVTGRTSRTLGTYSNLSARTPVVSRDGKWLAFVAPTGNGQGVRLRDIQSGAEHWLIERGLDDPSGVGSHANLGDGAPKFAFTHDSGGVVIGMEGRLWRVSVPDGARSEIPFTVPVRRPAKPLALTRHAITDQPRRIRSIDMPALSPDGNWLAFSALRRIWIMKIPRMGETPGRPRRLTVESGAEFYPAWSPDGQFIAYTTWQDGQGGDIRRARVAAAPGSSEILTTRKALYSHVAYAPGGAELAAIEVAPYASMLLTTDRISGGPGPSDSQPSIIRLSATKASPSATVTVAPRAYHAGYPIDQLYFTSDGRLYFGVTAIDWSGGTQQRATPQARVLRSQDSSRGYRGVIAPDGSRALAHRVGGGYSLVQIDASGAADPREALLSIDVASALDRPYGDADGAARRLKGVIYPMISWSLDGRRVLFSQGGTLFVGDVRDGAFLDFRRVDIPLEVPPDLPSGVLVLRNAKIITMRGDEILHHGDIVIVNNRIAAVGRDVSVPRGAHIIDATGTVIIPGYVDTHDHIQVPLGVEPDQHWEYLIRLASGITSSRDPSSDSNAVFERREREWSGELIAPRIFSTGPGFDGAEWPIRTLDDARPIARAYGEYWQTETFKWLVSLGTRRERQLMLEALREYALNGTVHTQYPYQALECAIDGWSGIEHAHPFETHEDLARMIAGSGTTMTHTVSMSLRAYEYAFTAFGSPLADAQWMSWLPFSEPATAGCSPCREIEYFGGKPQRNWLLRRLASPAQLAAVGGRSGVGSHGDVAALGFHYEMWFYGVGGMSNHEILRSATLHGARALGHKADLGSLEVGKLADLQVLDDDPLDDIRNTRSIRYVMKNGRLFKASDLAEVWPRERTLPDIYRRPSGQERDGQGIQ